MDFMNYIIENAINELYLMIEDRRALKGGE